MYSKSSIQSNRVWGAVLLLSALFSCTPTHKPMLLLVSDPVSKQVDLHFRDKPVVKGLALRAISQGSTAPIELRAVSDHVVEVVYSTFVLRIYHHTPEDVYIFSAITDHALPEGMELCMATMVGVNQYLGSYRYGPVKAWTHPVMATRVEDLPQEDLQHLLMLTADSTYYSMVPLISGDYVSRIGAGHGGLRVYAHSYRQEGADNEVFLAAVGSSTDPYQAVEHSYEWGLTRTDKAAALRKNKNFPDFFNYIGWCTWNSYGHKLHSKEVEKGLQTFADKGIHLPWLLLDDGWNKVSAYGTGTLQQWEAFEERFPDFKNWIAKTKKRYKIREIGVWHAFNGYWAGIDTSSALFSSTKDMLVPYIDKVAWDHKDSDTFWGPSPQGDKARSFYRTWHTYLQEQGIGFVKVDNQLIGDRITKGSGTSWGRGTAALQHHLHESVKEHFDGRIINCMDMTTDAVYHFGDSPIGRSSEDFFPDNQSYTITAGGAAVHVLCNVYNSLWWSQLVWPDFDIFQSHHPQAEYHAMARVLSGGPVYLTDYPGMQVTEVYRLLAGNDGRILRADVPCLPTRDCLFDMRGERPLKAFTKAGASYIVGVFHASDLDSVQGSVGPIDAEVPTEGEYLMISYRHKKPFRAHSRLRVPVRMARYESDLYFFYPIDQAHEALALGSPSRYLVPATVESQVWTEAKVLKVTAKDIYDTFWVYAPSMPKQVVDADGKKLDFSYSDHLITVSPHTREFVLHF